MSKEDSRALFESFSRPTKGSGMMYPVSWSGAWERYHYFLHLFNLNIPTFKA